MNKQRRKQIEEACKKFATISDKVQSIEEDMGTLKDEFETLRDEEQEYMDNMPESLHSSDKYSIAESSVQEMNTLIEWLDENMSAMGSIPDSDNLLNVI